MWIRCCVHVQYLSILLTNFNVILLKWNSLRSINKVKQMCHMAFISIYDPFISYIHGCRSSIQGKKWIWQSQNSMRMDKVYDFGLYNEVYDNIMWLKWSVARSAFLIFIIKSSYISYIYIYKYAWCSTSQYFHDVWRRLCITIFGHHVRVKSSN